MNKIFFLAVFITSITLIQASKSYGEDRISAGTLFADAKQVLNKNEIIQKELHFSEGILKDSQLEVESAYFTLDDDSFLVLTYNKDTQRIISLSVMFVPSYRPVKGLEVYKKLEMIEFEKDSYVLKMKKPNKG